MMRMIGSTEMELADNGGRGGGGGGGGGDTVVVLVVVIGGAGAGEVELRCRNDDNGVNTEEAVDQAIPCHWTVTSGDPPLQT